MPRGWVPPEPKPKTGKKGSRGASMRQRLTFLILRDGAYCHYCKIPFDQLDGVVNKATVDHVVPRSKGGSNAYENLLPACKRCNEQKSDTSYDEFIGIVTLYVAPKPAVVPSSPFLRIGRDDKRW